MLKRAFLGAIAFLLIAVSALLGGRAIRQHQISAARAIAVPPGVDSLEPVRLGGVDQWIRIRGRDRTRVRCCSFCTAARVCRRCRSVT